MAKGGIAMWPLLFLSILSVSTIIERIWFWSKVLLSENQILNQIMEVAWRNPEMAAKIARENRNHPLAKFLYAPLKLNNPEPDVFHFALEAEADEQLALMRRGDKIFEAVIALSPLLGLLGTVLGLITSLADIQISDLGTSSTTENLPLVSVTLVCVVGVTAVWPPASALGWETFKVEEMETVRAPWLMATWETRTLEVATMVPVRSLITTRAMESGRTSMVPTSAKKVTSRPR
jgi:hypothetical protein